MSCWIFSRTWREISYGLWADLSLIKEINFNLIQFLQTIEITYLGTENFHNKYIYFNKHMCWYSTNYNDTKKKPTQTGLFILISDMFLSMMLKSFLLDRNNVWTTSRTYHWWSLWLSTGIVIQQRFKTSGYIWPFVFSRDRMVC